MTIYLMAFAGGLILNCLPCILPTLGLKAAAAHKDIRWFAAGMMTVFVLLGALAATIGYAWGDHLQSQPIVIGMVAVVFACGLSYLGVWEPPALGFRDQYGAFGSGVLAMLLGSSCSGPMLGPVFGVAMSQPPFTAFSLFIAVGCGMVSPYLALPWIKNWLPKPGEWMLGFKKFGGWLLMGTTIWLLRSVDDNLMTPTLITLMVVAAACVAFNTEYRRWTLINAVLAIFAIFLATPSSKIEWRDYTPALLDESKIVMVEFTARYCLTCQLNEAILNTDPVAKVVNRRGVVALRAELSGEGAAANLLRSLGYNSVPVLAIYHPGRRPIVLPDLISQNQVIEALQQ